jgi:hypothetical protein
MRGQRDLGKGIAMQRVDVIEHGFQALGLCRDAYEMTRGRGFDADQRHIFGPSVFKGAQHGRPRHIEVARNIANHFGCTRVNGFTCVDRRWAAAAQFVCQRIENRLLLGALRLP